ncbi:GPI transamidase component PIG-T [Linum perenne]
MDRPSIYRGFYHSQRLHLTSNASNLVETDSGITLHQTLTVVLQPNSAKSDSIHSRERQFQPSWSLSSIFGRKVSDKCRLARSSKVYLQLDNDIISQQKENVNSTTSLASVGFTSETSFELLVDPDRVIEEQNKQQQKGSSVLYEFWVEKYNESWPFDLGLKWKSPVFWSCQQAPLRASRFLMGSGNERGAIAILLQSTGFLEARSVGVDDQAQPVEKFVEKVHVSPSKDKKSPGMMEMVLKLPCGVRSAALTLDFDKGFLHIDEYPPDANQGFDIPSAVISYTDFHSGMHFPDDDSIRKSPMLSSFQEKNPVKSYTEVLLVPLTTPDFSMPYNVITITCTVFALYFGSTKKNGPLLELLSRLSAKLKGKPLESRQSYSDSSSLISSKLVLKVILVAALAVIWQLYFT